MSANLGPDPLPTTIARADVAQHRSLFCSSYDACLDRAALEDWASWTCARCARFHGARRAGARPGSSPPGRQGTGAAAPRQAGGKGRARVRLGAAPPGGGARRHRAMGTHSLEHGRGAVHVRLQAPCMTALFVEAARAVAEVVCGPALEPAAEWAEELSVSAPDPEHLLVAWISELVARSVRTKVRFTEVDIVYLSERQVVTSIRGVRLAHVSARVKADAYRDPCLVQRREEVTAAPVLDVDGS